MEGSGTVGQLPERVEFLVLGAGPGGLQAAHLLHSAGAEYLVLDRADVPGSFFSTFPRHRRLISLNKRHNLFDEEYNWRHDWNSLLSDQPELRFTEYSTELYPDAEDLCRYLADFASRLELRLALGVTVTCIDRHPDGGFLVETDSGTVSCTVLLAGLGPSGPVVPDIPGIEHTTGYEEMPLDPADYTGKRVAILGQGNSAFETADFLAPHAALVHVLAKRPVQFAWDTHFTGDLRAVNAATFDLFQLKSMHAVLAPRLLRIDRDGEVLRTTHEYDYPTAPTPGSLQLSRDYDVMIRCCGWRWDHRNLYTESARPALDEAGKFPRLTPWWESVNIPGLYFIGAVMGANDRQAASGFIHGFRYNIRTLIDHLLERYEEVPFPVETLRPFDWKTFVEGLYRRLSEAGSLFAMYGYLADQLVVAADGTDATYTRDLPIVAAEDLDHGDAHVFTVTLEFGFENHKDPAHTYFGPSDPLEPEHGAFLHPVVRYRRGGDRAVFHLGDSLLARWDRPHGAGGAVGEYADDFDRWALTLLGRPIGTNGPTTQGAYRPWSAEEIEQWQRSHPPVAPVAYRNDLSTSIDNARRVEATMASPRRPWPAEYD